MINSSLTTAVIRQVALHKTSLTTRSSGAGLGVFTRPGAAARPTNPLFKLNSALLTSHFAGRPEDNYVARFRNAFK